MNETAELFLIVFTILSCGCILGVLSAYFYFTVKPKISGTLYVLESDDNDSTTLYLEVDDDIVSIGKRDNVNLKVKKLSYTLK